MTLKKPVWPAKRPIPAFKSHPDEVTFWEAHDFEQDQPDDGWEDVPRREETKKEKS